MNRSLNAPHRSLPDIPTLDPSQLDTNSDLYATVGDKTGDKTQDQSRKLKQWMIYNEQYTIH